MDSFDNPVLVIAVPGRIGGVCSGIVEMLSRPFSSTAMPNKSITAVAAFLGQ
jgi:hypothetical protein